MSHYDKFEEMKCDTNTSTDKVRRVLNDVLEDVERLLVKSSLKHDRDGEVNFLKEDGNKCSHRAMHDSMFHHLAMSFANQRIDSESGEDHLLHGIARHVIFYYRLKHGLVHTEDRRSKC